MFASPLNNPQMSALANHHLCRAGEAPVIFAWDSLPTKGKPYEMEPKGPKLYSRSKFYIKCNYRWTSSPFLKAF